MPASKARVRRIQLSQADGVGQVVAHEVGPKAFHGLVYRFQV